MLYKGTYFVNISTQIHKKPSLQLLFKLLLKSPNVKATLLHYFFARNPCQKDPQTVHYQIHRVKCSVKKR